MTSRTTVLLIAAIVVGGSAGCARIGDLGGGLGRTLESDARTMGQHEGPGYPGRYMVDAIGLEPAGAPGPFALYRPRGVLTPLPAVVFLPGRFSPEDQYESYGRLLASHGFVVLVLGRYGPQHTDAALVADTRWLVDWMTAQDFVDARRIGVAGHSMGGRDAIWAAVEDERLRGVVSIDPGGSSSYPVIYGVVHRLRAPLLLIGAELAWRGDEVCAPRSTNYQRFFAQAPPGTLELTIRGADHVQLMDEPDRMGQYICRVGTADSTRVRSVARAATVQFFEETLNGAPHRTYDGDLAFVRIRHWGNAPPAEAPVVVPVVHEQAVIAAQPSHASIGP